MTKPERVFALIDCNSFYARCELVFRLDLRSKPVVVLSNKDGCVIVRSADTKPWNKMDEPYFPIKDKLRKHGIVACSSDYAFYGCSTLGRSTQSESVKHIVISAVSCRERVVNSCRTLP